MNDEDDKGFDLARLIFYAVLGALVLGFVFVLGMSSGSRKDAAYRAVIGLADTLRLVFTEARNMAPGGEPIHFLQPARHEGDGVTVNETDDDRLVFISGFFDGSNELRLIERDGSVVARWPVAYSEMLPLGDGRPGRPNTDWNIDIHGAVAMPDGSVVFNWEYAGTARLSRCGEVLWTLDDLTHHSLARAEGGGFWIPGRRFLPPYDGTPATNLFPPFTSKAGSELYSDDLLMRVSDDGEIVESVSLMQVFYDSGLTEVLTSNGFSFWPEGAWDAELLHLNKIGELPAALAPAFPGFEAGDLVVSLRQYNLVAVIDPEAWRVRWHQVGPWIRQHDPEFLADGTIAVFDNGTYRMALDDLGRPLPDLPLSSAIVTVDPVTGATRDAYGRRASQEFRTVIRGKVDPTPGGGFLVTEFEAGRIFEVDAEGRLIWEYINRHDATRVLELTEGRLYDRSYFSVSDWSCPEE